MKKVPTILFVLVAVIACTPAVPYEAVSMETGTPDLYIDASSSRATANAALQQAQLQEQFLTATAQAPIVHITETAAALIVVQTQGSFDLTSTAILWTPTPSPTPTISPSPTANATTTKVFAVLAAEGTQITNNTERDNLQLERERYTNSFWAILPGLSYALVAGILILFVMSLIRRGRYQAAKVDARGNVLPLLDVVDGKFTDIDRSPNYQGPLSNNTIQRLLEAKLKLATHLPVVTAERQDATTERDQMTDLATRGLPNPTPDAKERKQLAGQQAMKQLSAPNMQSRYKILDPATSDLSVINGEIIQVLDQDWQEAKRK